MYKIRKKNEGVSITFELRGISPEDVRDIWEVLEPCVIIATTGETGTCFYSFKGICAEVRKTKKGNYTVWFGKEDKDV
jgi:hypothetical protein